MAMMAAPLKILDELRGIENFDFPGTRRLLDVTPEAPDVVHLHNLHGGYFDLRELPRLSRSVPLVVTLHDQWMLTGHCAHSIDCERWRQGCGTCPYLDVDPAVRRDATDRNWLRKKQIYRNSSLYIAAPSGWLLERAQSSILSEAIIDARLIPNGIDLSVFHPAEQSTARRRTGIPARGRVLLFSGYAPSRSAYKDLATLHTAAEILDRHVGNTQVTLVVLGETGRSHRVGRSVVIRFAGFEPDERRVAAYYQAADVYVHAARAENHSLSIMEALACGLPVVATNVGGIPEQVKDLHGPGTGANAATGILTPPGHAEELAAAITLLLKNPTLLRTLSSNAARDARQRFDQEAQVDAYLAWYEEMIEQHSQR
jgi:glycosyltransferase involved in cell wall biosynthesis